MLDQHCAQSTSFSKLNGLFCPLNCVLFNWASVWMFFFIATKEAAWICANRMDQSMRTLQYYFQSSLLHSLCCHFLTEEYLTRRVVKTWAQSSRTTTIQQPKQTVYCNRSVEFQFSIFDNMCSIFKSGPSFWTCLPVCPVCLTVCLCLVEVCSPR